MRACEIFTASMINPYLFVAYKYNSWGDYLASQNKSIVSYPMGILTDHSVPEGKYYMSITKEEITPYIQTETTVIHSL